MSVFLIVLPLESMAHGLFHELGNCLGGTCVGYAVVIPTNFCRYPNKFSSHILTINKDVCFVCQPLSVINRLSTDMFTRTVWTFLFYKLYVVLLFC